MKIPFAIVLMLMGCQSGPPPRTFVLGPPEIRAADPPVETRGSILELRRVGLPDYLDTSDIQSRDGRNELIASTGGRWGERLSVGIARALREGLTRRLPGVVVTGAALPGQTVRRLSVDVEAFDVMAGGRCVLKARWTESGGIMRGTFVAQSARSGDAAVVAAMSDAVEQLAAEIARSTKKGGA